MTQKSTAKRSKSEIRFNFGEHLRSDLAAASAFDVDEMVGISPADRWPRSRSRELELPASGYFDDDVKCFGGFDVGAFDLKIRGLSP